MSMATPPVLFIAARAGISWGYTDQWFSHYWANMLRIKVGRLAYHVQYPAENSINQMDHFFRIVDDSDWEHDRLVLDLELDHGCSRYTITTCTNRMLEICRSRTGRYPLIYSRAEWVNRFLAVQDMPSDIFWWMAQYLKRRLFPLIYTPEHPGPPDKPIIIPRKNILIHQTAEYTKSIGKSGRRYMDYNRWQGKVLNVLAYFNFGVIEPPILPPTPDPRPLEEQVKRLWSIHPEVHFKSPLSG